MIRIEFGLSTDFLRREMRQLEDDGCSGSVQKTSLWGFVCWSERLENEIDRTPLCGPAPTYGVELRFEVAAFNVRDRIAATAAATMILGVADLGRGGFDTVQ
jgi:hypothetical protein